MSGIMIGGADELQRADTVAADGGEQAVGVGHGGPDHFRDAPAQRDAQRDPPLRVSGYRFEQPSPRFRGG
jgi:hypothetical protein